MADIVAPTQRLAWLDYAKAIGIVLVVFGHASRSIGRTPGLVWSDTLQTLDTIIYAFHMPLFFLLAGYVSGLNSTQVPAKFVKALWWGIVVPYLVWSTIWIGLKVLLPGAANVPLSLADLSQVFWRPVEHFWFLYHLFFIRLGWYAANGLRPLPGQRPHPLIIAAAAASLIAPLVSADLDWLAAFFRNYAIYGVGLVWLPLMMKRFAPSPVANLVLFGLALCLWGFAIGGDALVLLTAAGGALVVAGIAKALPQPSTPAWRAFAFLGEASLAIYVMHLLAGAAVRAALSKSGLISENTLLLTATVAGLVLPAFVYWLVLSASRMTGHPLARWLGLGPSLRSAYIPLWGADKSARPPLTT